uniref:Uncharacterized protein n=1 Tax=Caulobacter phage BL57 TaxID=3348355 RepID=A0AB74UNN8_9VIRU
MPRGPVVSKYVHGRELTQRDFIALVVDKVRKITATPGWGTGRAPATSSTRSAIRPGASPTTCGSWP